MKSTVKPILKQKKALKQAVPAAQGYKKKHIVAFSGGKDSAAMLLRMIEIGMPIDQILFCDTGKEFPQLYEYVKRMDKYTTEKIGVPVTTLTPPTTWDDWFFGGITRGERLGQKRGWPLICFGCWWTREAKFKMMNPICTGHYRYIGFAADEPKRIKAFQKDPKLVGSKFPLADWGWSEKDALEYLKKTGMYEQFHLDFDRTGCYLCPQQGEASLRMLARKYPEQWDQLMFYAKSSWEGDNFASRKFNLKWGYPQLKQIEAQERGKQNGK